MRTARVALLEGILKNALDSMKDLHAVECSSQDVIEVFEDGDCTVSPSGLPCNCWQYDARKALEEPKNEIQPGHSRLDGEECGDPECGDSSTFHASAGTGICTRVGCGCMRFVPTGRPNTKAR